MDISKLPWKETLLLFLLIGLNMSMSNLQLKTKYSQTIGMHQGVRFLIIFLTAFTLFSLDLGGKYSILTRIIVSVIVAILVQVFFSYNVSMMNLEPAKSKVITV